MNAAARLIASSEGMVGAASTATEVESAIRLVALAVEGVATDCCATPRIRGPRSEAWLRESLEASRVGAPRDHSLKQTGAPEATSSRPAICHRIGMKRALPWVLGVVILTAVLVVGLSQAGDRDEEPARPAAPFDLQAARAKLKGSPAPLAALHEQSGRLLDGGVPAFEKRLAALEGTPVVINKWASWCNPCRAEFPVFQQLATERGREIAFLGVNSGDSTEPARKFLAEYPVPFPSYLRPGREDRARDPGAGQLPRDRVRRRARRDGVHPPGRLHVGRRAGGGRRPLPGRMTAGNTQRTSSAGTGEVRVDPVSGLKVIIAAARAGRPGGQFALAPEPPIDTEKDPFLPGHEDRTPPELYAVRADGGEPDTPGWSVRVVPNLYPAIAPGGEELPAEAVPDLFSARPATGAHEVIVNAPDAVTSMSDLEPAQVQTAMEAWRARMREHAGAACVHVLVNEGREGGASLPAHPRAALRARLRPGRGRARARALRRLRDAHDGRQPARRPRAGGGAAARARGRGRRRGGADGAVRVAAAVPADDRPAPAARPLRGRRARSARGWSTRR